MTDETGFHYRTVGEFVFFFQGGYVLDDDEEVAIDIV